MTFTNRIEDQMTPYPVTADPKMMVSEAAALMKEKQIRHLPVLDAGKVVGILSDRDARQALALPGAFQLMVGDVMHDQPYCVSVGTPLAEVAREMATRKIGSAVILSKHNKPVGIFTTTDAMAILAELLEDGPEPESKWVGPIERYMQMGYVM